MTRPSNVANQAQNIFVSWTDLLNSDGLIKDDLLENDIDFDLWDIDNLQPPEGTQEPQQHLQQQQLQHQEPQQQQWQVQKQPNIVEIKQVRVFSQTLFRIFNFSKICCNITNLNNFPEFQELF